MPFHMNKSGFGLWNCISKQARYFYKTRSYQLQVVISWSLKLLKWYQLAIVRELKFNALLNVCNGL